MDGELFRQAVACLQKANLNFWVDQGTLSGLVREGRIIPWDMDFDMGVWDHEVTEWAIIKAFDRKDFRIVPLGPYGKKALHILPRNEEIEGKVDITFYAKQDSRAIHKSCTPKDTLWTDLLVRVDRFLDPHIQSKEKYKYLLKKALHKGLPSGVKNLIRRGVNYFVFSSYSNGIQLTYDFPAQYFENLRSVTFLGVEFNIPADAEGYLELAYGKDWRTPNQWTHWWEGATYINGQRNI
jgi:phosphorylcholine metabolism protein LicD